MNGLCWYIKLLYTCLKHKIFYNPNFHNLSKTANIAAIAFGCNGMLPVSDIQTLTETIRKYGSTFYIGIAMVI